MYLKFFFRRTLLDVTSRSFLGLLSFNPPALGGRKIRDSRDRNRRSTRQTPSTLRYLFRRKATTITDTQRLILTGTVVSFYAVVYRQVIQDVWELFNFRYRTDIDFKLIHRVRDRTYLLDKLFNSAELGEKISG